MSTRALDARASACHRRVRDAIKAGELVRPEFCERCGVAPGMTKTGAPKIQAHHHDYALPLEVEWLCTKCHRAITPLPIKMGAPTLGSRNGQARLKEDQIAEIRNSPLGAVKLSRIYGLSVTTMKDVRSGRYWRHVK